MEGRVRGRKGRTKEEVEEEETSQRETRGFVSKALETVSIDTDARPKRSPGVSIPFNHFMITTANDVNAGAI